MTLAGDVVEPPSAFARARAIWRALPPGTIPALLVAATAILLAAIFFIGVLLIALPALLVLTAVAVLARSVSRSLSNSR